LGYSFFIPLMSMPADLGSPWTVAPGATLLGATLGYLLRRTSDRAKDQPWRGAVLGALPAPLNVPLTLQVTLVAFNLRGGRVALWPLPYDIREAVIHTLPVALPCGVLLGMVIGLLERWYPRRPGTAGS
jgi:NhaP-type Na+/H+ or K+/H+ antiporter